MKVIIDIDNDQIIGICAMMGAKKEEKETVKKYLAEHEEMTLDQSMFEKDDDLKAVPIAIAAFVIAQIVEEMNV